MVKSLVSKLSAASSTLSIASSFSSSHGKNENTTTAASTAISGDNYLKHRNDPGRFFGDGVQFKAKLIGILEVGEARGDRMCQEALQDLKMAIRAAGEHKQRITIHVTIDGLRLRDEKTGDSLYHHPVHKISFIAQDMTDSRAFGYIFGSPDSGHRFFGIKTDKAASQVVLAMRDLFQVVFELKKKEIELAREQIQWKNMHPDDKHKTILAALNNTAGPSTSDASELTGVDDSAKSAALVNMLRKLENTMQNTPNSNRLGVNLNSKGASKEISPESVADLVDLEQELSVLQRGITQMERITPNDGHNQHSTLTMNSTKSSTGGVGGSGGGGDDPFGDSFTSFPTLPPPEPGRLRSKTTIKNIDIPSTSTNNTGNSSTLLSPSATQTRSSPISLATSSATTGAVTSLQPLDVDDDDNWLRELDAHSDVFDTSKTVVPGLMGMPPLATTTLTSSGGITLNSRAPLAARESSDTPPNHIYETVSCSTNVIPDISSELSQQATNTDTNTLANSSSLSDIFQSAAESAQNSKLDIKSDAFTDLDPLGTGRTRPYVDKKYFFQELKNPPKKVLKDLTTSTMTAGTATTITSMADNVNSMTSSLTDDILNLNDLELKSQQQYQQQQQQHHQIQQQLLQQQMLSTNINNLLTTTSHIPANTELATLTTSTVYSHASSALTNTIINTNTAMANNVNVSSTNSTSNTASSTSLICTCPTSIIVTCTTTNASTNRFTNNIGNNNSTNNNLLTHHHHQTNKSNMMSVVGGSVGGEGGQSGQMLAALKTAATTSTTKLTSSLSSSSSTQPQSTTTTINQTNTLRFSRYPPLEPVLAVSNTDPVLLPRSTDPFSPTRKKSDPFEEGADIFGKLDPFDFENLDSEERFSGGGKPEIPHLFPSTEMEAGTAASTASGLPVAHEMLSLPLQVSLPPEGDVGQPISTVRSRPIPSTMGSMNPAVAGPNLPPGSMLRQQTADVISSISNKKMPHLFGQSSRFSKRDSNSINMRRLQESDSLSETETAPEPPPRPDSSSYAEPPPLPPKKQFNDIVIRPRTTSNSHSISTTNRYNSLNWATAEAESSGLPTHSYIFPPIPLPSRRVGRTDGSYPGPGRPRKPGHTEDDYLAPLSSLHSATATAATGNTNVPDVPPLLPPPTQTSSRARPQRQHSLKRPQDIYENKNEILQQQLQKQLQQQQQQHKTSEPTPPPPPIVPDITLSQLLTLGIEDLALKLNVPTSKLSTMTLVELTLYLSEFLEQTKPRPEPKMEIPSTVSYDEPPEHTPPIFKVNFDQEATFVAKFDDTFGEDFNQTSSASVFEANFAQFDSVKVEPPVQAINSAVPSADRYAVFREIIDLELQHQQEQVDLIGDVMETDEIVQNNDEKPYDTTTPITDLDMNNKQQDLLSGDMIEVTGPQPPKIDAKISEVLAQAKDRYAALRDLILVENLFEKPPPQVPPRNGVEIDSLHNESKSPFQGFSGFDDEDDQDLRQLMDQASTLDSTTQQQRLGLVDSRGFLVEPSSSAITVEDDEDEEDDERRNTREDNGGLSSGDSNEKEHDKNNLPTSKYEQLASSNQQLEDIEAKTEKYEDTPKISITQTQMPLNNDSKYLSVGSVASSGLSGSKDDLEIDDLMHRAISNLSLDSRDRNSPAMVAQQQQTSGITTMTPPHFNDVSTSPIPLPRSPAGASLSSQAKSPSNKSPQQHHSPLPSQLTVVSQLIDAATKQIQNEAVSKPSNDSWATFDTPQHQSSSSVVSDKRARPSAKVVTKANNFLNLPPPPGSVSNNSQNDSAIESPCSSDPRDEAWHKNTMGGSSLSLGHHSTNVGGSSSAQRRYHKKERQNTSSSSRDLSWDEDQGGGLPPPHVMDYPQSKRMPGQSQGSLATDRHGYYRRHARRMNSCDEDYDYEQDYSNNRRDQPCKYKHSLSRSRDNFDMDSPGWYHHQHPQQHPHHTWSSQDIEQARGRTFDRSAYERTTYGPPIYDKRGVGPPLPPSASYERRSGGGVYEKRSKYYRGDSNPRSSNADRGIYNLDDFDEMLAASGKIPPHLASMYEEMKADCCSPPLTAHQRQQRAADYMYDRERKSFDRESLESYEGSNVPQRRRRRSYDSGGIPSDPYGSCDSREDYHRERCVMTADKSRSLRKSLKSLRVSGDIDYDQDSEKEYHYREQRSRCDIRSLQRPSQLSTQGISGGTSTNVVGSQSRIRKSSGSSPWDGSEPALPGQKPLSSSWKRPSSAAEAERRLAESRRSAVKGQTPSGSDEDKDRRYRKKRGTRNKDLPGMVGSGVGGGRYRGSNYDYISCEDLDDDAEDYVDEEEEEDHGIEDDEISPADEDKFARLEMRRHEMHNRMMDSHVRRRKDVVPSQVTQTTSMAYRKGAKGNTYARRPLPPPTEPKHTQDYGFDDDDGEYEQTPTPRSNTSSALPTATPNTNTKFSFDIGFESDFNQTSPPPAPAGTASSCNSTPAANVSVATTPATKSFRFSNDFSAGQDREKHFQQHHPAAGSLQQYDLENRAVSPQTSQTQTSTPKLRFDDNVKISQFDDAFEDDFSKATFDAFQNDDDVQWQETSSAMQQKASKQQIRNNKLQQRQQDLIKKSESVNIFAKKVEDPFEDDEFFNSPPTTQQQNSSEKIENHKSSSNSTGPDGGGGGGSNGNNFQPQHWDDDNTNFAKFDENM